MPETESDLPSVYVETTIISYLTSRPTRDPILARHQDMTRRWWRTRNRYRLCISPLVVQEAAMGDPGAARKRLVIVRKLTALEPDVTTENLGNAIRAELQIPTRAMADAIHLAYAIHHEMDYLLTWNCTHLANAANMRRLADFIRREGLWSPIICTPAEMAEVDEHE